MRIIFGKCNKHVLMTGAIVGIFVVLLASVNTKVQMGRAKPAFDYDYHFLVDVGGRYNYFAEDFIRGAQDAVDGKNILLEITGHNSAHKTERGDTIEKGIRERVDGVIHLGQALDDSQKELVMSQQNRSVVVFVGNESRYEGVSYMGPSNYNQGRDLIRNIPWEEEQKELVILLDEMEKDMGNLRWEGMQRELMKRPDITVLEVIYIPSNILEAMDVIQRSILNYPQLNYIIGTNEAIVTGIARGVVDLNRVRQVSIGGIGQSPETQRYLEKKVISFTIDPQAYELGRTTVNWLYEYEKALQEEQFRIYTDYTLQRAGSPPSLKAWGTAG